MTKQKLAVRKPQDWSVGWRILLSALMATVIYIVCAVVYGASTETTFTDAGEKAVGNIGVWLPIGAMALMGGALIWLLMKTQDLYRLLQLSETRFRLLCEKAPVLIDSFDRNGRVLLWNAELEKRLGYSADEMCAMKEPLRVLYPDTYQEEKSKIVTPSGVFIERRPRTKNGTPRVQMWATMGLPNGDVLSVGLDVTETREAEAALQESEEQFRQMFTKQQTVMYLVDPASRRILDVNEAALWFYGYSREEFKLLRVADLCGEDSGAVIPPDGDGRKPWGGYWETRHRLRNGEVRDVEVRSTLIRLSTRHFFFDIVHDVTERRQAEDKLRHISFHDALTGLYNRAYFEAELMRLDQDGYTPAGLIVCDVDGLKLLNDALGHKQGDNLLIDVAGVLSRCFRGGDVVTRIGGDEFAVILPYADTMEIQLASERIYREIEEYNRDVTRMPLNMSVGYAARESSGNSMQDLYKEADGKMYREKLRCRQNARGAIARRIMTLLAERDYFDDGHAERLQEMLLALGRDWSLGERRLHNLQLLARFHDIGKVGIAGEILQKSDFLTPEEWQEVQRHCEIGQRIAVSTPELIAIADAILKHHEWWNGEGYPLGLAGEDIPLECRLLAIVDAYDVMTHQRPYRSALSQQEALTHLRQGAGIQFDPREVERFCRLLPTLIMSE
ncbi:MAG TPA: diguanylate cyclase [Patescibacteria group bacterium]|nr:diguanylate cyclase [Patescibacteria group bacterium]